LFCCNGGIVLHLSVGHLFLDYFYYPWIIESLWVVNAAPRTRRAIGFAALGGALLGLSCQSVIHYGFVYIAITVAGLFGHGALRAWKQGVAKGLLLAYGVFGFTVLAVGGSRLLMCMVVNRDYPRVERWELNMGFQQLARSFLLPLQSMKASGWAWLGWWEWGCYLGLVSVLLFAASALFRRRAYHWVFLIGILMFLYTGFPMPYYWLSKYVPLFQSMRVPQRIRIWLIPYFALGVVSGLDLLGAHRKAIATGVAIFALFDVSLNASYAFQRAYEDKETPAKTEALEPNTKIYPMGYLDRDRGFSQYLAVCHGYTHVPGYEPAISELLWRMAPAEIPVHGVNVVGYSGEFYTNEGSVEPSLWTPNRIVFEGVKGALRLNMNPGSYWAVNGREVFSALRVADISTPFVVFPDAEGRVVLEIRPKGWEWALWVSILSLLLAAGLAWAGCSVAEKNAKRSVQV
jgi:hypothetical protein